jgi:hypothetical protein
VLLGLLVIDDHCLKRASAVLVNVPMYEGIVQFACWDRLCVGTYSSSDSSVLASALSVRVTLITPVDQQTPISDEKKLGLWHEPQ